MKQKLLGIWHRVFPSKKKQEYSIGIYQGDNPLNLSPYKENPVLTKEDVTDRNAAYIADPFMVKLKDLWYMFFEIKLLNSYKTELAYATSFDGLRWHYQRVIDIKPLFRSYPCVFESEGEYYMVPETAPLKSIIIYKAEEFPEKWKEYTTIAEGRDYVDPTIFRYKDKWWLFVSNTNNSELYAFYADKLEGSWQEHSLNPLIFNNPSSARPGGRVIEYEGNLYRLAQDCGKEYGKRVKAFKILTLKEYDYEEEYYGVVLEGKEKWNSEGMHTLDAHREGDKWIASVDGYKIIKK